jgi:flagellar basal-body rod modification protein FlgD
VVVEIADASGRVVRRIDLGAQPAGTHTFAWDGAGDDGARLPPGDYLIAAHGRIGGRTESLATRVAARIDSVTLGGGAGLILNLDSFGPVPLAAVTRFL